MLIPLQKQHLTLSSHVLIFWTAERSSASTRRPFINVICRGYLRDVIFVCSLQLLIGNRSPGERRGLERSAAFQH